MKVLSMLVLFGAVLVTGHTFIAAPIPRDPKVHWNIPNLGGECGGNAASMQTYTRGQSIRWEWGRNNHHTGFVQASVLPLELVEGNGDNQQGMFDDPANIIQVTCYNQESCKANNIQKYPDIMGLGVDPINKVFQSNMCHSSLTIPNYLADGEYVLKSAVFGNGGSFGQRDMPHPAYSNCHNFKIAGGPMVDKATTGNAHIKYNFSDYAIGLLNTERNHELSTTGHCTFLATNTHMGCREGKDPKEKTKYPQCSGKIADISRYAGAEGELYNYLIGVPAYHPSSGSAILIERSGAIRKIAISPTVPTAPTAPARKKCDIGIGCLNTKTCCGPDASCVAKDLFWAVCLKNGGKCIKGVHVDDPIQFQTAWSCEVLFGNFNGSAPPSAAPGPTTRSSDPPSAAPGPTTRSSAPPSAVPTDPPSSAPPAPSSAAPVPTTVDVVFGTNAGQQSGVGLVGVLVWVVGIFFF